MDRSKRYSIELNKIRNHLANLETRTTKQKGDTDNE